MGNNIEDYNDTVFERCDECGHERRERCECRECRERRECREPERFECRECRRPERFEYRENRERRENCECRRPEHFERRETCGPRPSVNRECVRPRTIMNRGYHMYDHLRRGLGRGYDMARCARMEFPGMEFPRMEYERMAYAPRMINTRGVNGYNPNFGCMRGCRTSAEDRARREMVEQRRRSYEMRRCCGYNNRACFNGFAMPRY